MPVGHFKIACPVPPIQLRQSALLWDKRDLDLRIEDVKTGMLMTTHAAILARLR
jgi:hypothetical protein